VKTLRTQPQVSIGPQGVRKGPCKGLRSYGGGKRIDPCYSAGYLYSSLTVTAGQDICPTSRAVTIRIVPSVHFSLHAIPSSSDYIPVQHIAQTHDTLRLSRRPVSTIPSLVQPLKMDVANNASREVCAVCWGVCGFASSRENLEMAKSREGLTSFCQAQDLLAASAQCEMCDYLFNHAKEDTNRFDLDARIAINIQFYNSRGPESFRGSVDYVRICTKVEGKDSRWFADLDWSEELGVITWSVLAHRGSYPARNLN